MEILIVVAIIALLATVAVPNFARARAFSQQKICISNLRQIDVAKHQWALEAKVGDPTRPTQADLMPYLRGNTFPSCPANGTYRLRRVTRPPICDLPGHLLTMADDYIDD